MIIFDNDNDENFWNIWTNDIWWEEDWNEFLSTKQAYDKVWKDNWTIEQNNFDTKLTFFEYVNYLFNLNLRLFNWLSSIFKILYFFIIFIIFIIVVFLFNAIVNFNEIFQYYFYILFINNDYIYKIIYIFIFTAILIFFTKFIKDK